MSDPAADESSAAGDDARYRRTWGQRLGIVLCLTATLAAFCSAGALAFVADKINRVQRVSVGDALSAPLQLRGVTSPTTGSTGSTGSTGETAATAASPAGSSSAVNILVVGVDNADGLPANDRRRMQRDDGIRSDTIMLVRLDPATGSAEALSFPRDLWVGLGGTSNQDRINAALPIGGPPLLIQTIAQDFQVHVDHFVQIDFAQFQRLVDVVGGVPIPFDRPVRDDNSGLYVGQPGCVMLDGGDALDYVRSRYLQYMVDGAWEADPYSDLSRIRRQQDFIRRALSRARAKGFGNPITANRLIDVGLDAVTVDDHFSVSEMVSLARRFSSLDPADLRTYSLPVVPDTTAGGASILRLVEDRAAPLLDRFRGVSSAPAPPSDQGIGYLPGEGRSDICPA
jgi:LCP family protein required for cell wall assembly